MHSPTAEPAPRPRRRAGRRARTALVAGLAWLVAGHLALVWVTERWRPEWRDPEYANRLHRLQKRTAASPRPRCVVMLGSSRTQWGLHAGALEGPLSAELGGPVVVFNFGTPGAGPLHELFTWQRLRRDGVRPDLVLVEVLPAQYCTVGGWPGLPPVQVPTEGLTWQDLPLLELYSPDRTPGLRRRWLVAQLTPLYSWRFNLIARLIPQLLPGQLRHNQNLDLDDSGCLPSLHQYESGAAQRADSLRRARESYAHLVAHYHRKEESLRALNELLASLRAEGIRTALVAMPEGDQYRSWYGAGVWEKVREAVEEVGDRYGAPLVNAREWLPGEENFQDSHHMAPRGGALFTERLGREVILPLLRGDGEPGTTPYPPEEGPSTRADPIPGPSVQADAGPRAVRERPVRSQ